MSLSRLLQAINCSFRKRIDAFAQSWKIGSCGDAGGNELSVDPAKLAGTRTRAAERLRQEVQLLEELKLKGSLSQLRATERRIIWEELMDLERETVWREFDDTIERIISKTSTAPGPRKGS